MLTVPKLVAVLMLPFECVVSFIGCAAVHGAIGFCAYQKLQAPYLLQAAYAHGWLFLLLPLGGLACMAWVPASSRLSDVQALSVGVIRLILALLVLLLVLGVCGLPFYKMVAWTGDFMRE